MTAADLDSLVTTCERPVLVEFFAFWRSPLTRSRDPLDLLADRRPDLVVARLDVDAEWAALLRHEVFEIPTTVLFVGGHQLGRVAGAQPPALIEAFVDHACRSVAPRSDVLGRPRDDEQP